MQLHRIPFAFSHRDGEVTEFPVVAGEGFQLVYEARDKMLWDDTIYLPTIDYVFIRQLWSYTKKVENKLSLYTILCFQRLCHQHQNRFLGTKLSSPREMAFSIFEKPK